jgi:hypothetical protein
MATQTFPAADRAVLLRRTLQANSVFSLLAGTLLVVDAGPIAAFIGLPAAWILIDVGVLCLVYAALLFLATRRSPIARGHALAFVIADAAWVVASAAILLGGWAPLTTAGVWAVLIVADIVAVFTALQYVGWRRLA